MIQATENKTELEVYFERFKKHIIGNNACFDSKYGKQELLYADWIASGRLYRPIEDVICDNIGPMMANTHSFSSESGKTTTYVYHEARRIIKNHVNATHDDVLVTTGTGMTAALNKLLRILDLKPKNSDTPYKDETDRPVVFISHMEHHSNQACWFEIDADVVILPPNEALLIQPGYLEKELVKYKDRKIKIGSFTACSNVTGIISPYQELAKIMHRHNGLCFVDFAASAPYVDINMHPENKAEKLDAIFFSPHKFLGGPGSCGVLVYDKKLHKKAMPDNPGGGNIKWTKPSGEQCYFDDPEVREDGGTPGILQVMRAALAINLKEKMGTENIHQREVEVLRLFSEALKDTETVELLGDPSQKRIGCVSFNIKKMHYNLVVRLLNDRFGIQVRGGWSCASTYAHYLFGIDTETSETIIGQIEQKNLTNKPGWVRVSLHPTISNKEVLAIADAIKAIVKYREEWAQDYTYNPQTNEFDPTEPVAEDSQRYKEMLSF
ncbi:aminotransferase class V-fold PLP-dependent enzyme [Marixanthomonas spongiae]|uniref:Selenocysteine lyase n=1 Tax=Marixanthomonas spongiae TaxID=2174845 RepID=A0A2U0HUS9_9FLAO|nr:aminotransferase class V-fold PLP-dependent enzyme [Marixanthomonas spongiae]PVW12623.1 selenocysteine lyase [Marixanthomonas spongiae]